MWPPKQEMHLRKCDRYISTEIPTVNHRPQPARRSCLQAIGIGLLRSIPEMVMWHWQPKPEVFLSRTTTVRMEIPTANLRFAITESCNKVHPGDCVNDRQSEMAMSFSPYGVQKTKLGLEPGPSSYASHTSGRIGTKSSERENFFTPFLRYRNFSLWNYGHISIPLGRPIPIRQSPLSITVALWIVQWLYHTCAWYSLFNYLSSNIYLSILSLPGASVPPWGKLSFPQFACMPHDACGRRGPGEILRFPHFKFHTLGPNTAP